MNPRKELCEQTGYGPTWTANYGKVTQFYAKRQNKQANYRKLGSITVSKVGETFTFTHKYYLRDGPFAALYADNTVEVLKDDPAMGEYLALEWMTGLWFNNWKKASVRHHLYARSGFGGPNKTYVVRKGLKFYDRKCLNPEVAVNEKRVISPEARAAWKALFSPWRTLMRAVSRLEEVQRAPYRTYNFSEIVQLLSNEPNAHDAEVLFAIGLRMTMRDWSTSEGQSRFSTSADKRAVNNVSKALREEYYRENHGYTWEK